MALHTEEALLLDVRDLQDRDRIVEFLTRERGKLAGVAKGARTKHSRFSGQLQPLAKARITWFESQGRELVRISGVDLMRPAARLQGDLDGILLTSYLADHLITFVQENEPGDLFYRLADSVLEGLLAGVDRDLAVRYFEAWMLRLAGVYPPPLGCPSCGRPLALEAALPADSGGLVCIECAGGDPGPPPVAPPGVLVVGEEVLGFLRRIHHESLRKVAAEPPSEATLRRAEELTAKVRRSFLQAELKSYRVMARLREEP